MVYIHTYIHTYIYTVYTVYTHTNVNRRNLYYRRTHSTPRGRSTSDLSNSDCRGGGVRKGAGLKNMGPVIYLIGGMIYI